MTDDRSAVERAGEVWTDERVDEMRALPEPQRVDAIEAAPNVVGFEQFGIRNKQVALREAYRKPKNPPPAGGHHA